MSRSGKGRILAGLVFLVILACLLPVGAGASPLPTALDTGTGGGYFAGEGFLANVSHTFYNSDNSKLGGGTAVYNKDNHTLTLTNVVINDLQAMLQNTSAPNCFIYAQKMQQLTVELVGTNKINCGNGRGIQLFTYTDVYELTIKGPGTLELTTDGADCISAPKIVVDGANLTVNQLGDHYGINAGDDALTLQNKANVNVTSKSTTESAISAKGTIGIMGGSKLTVKGPSGSSTTRAVPSPAVSTSSSIMVDGSELNVNVTDVNGGTAIYGEGDITIQNGSTVNAATSNNDEYAIRARKGALTVANSTLNVTGRMRAIEDIAIDTSTVTATGNAKVHSNGIIAIQKSTVTVNAQDEEALNPQKGISISDSRVTVTGNTVGIFAWDVGATLTIERSDVTVEVTNTTIPDAPPAIWSTGDILIKNATVTAKGGGTAYPAIYTNGKFIIADEDGQPTSEVIAKGGIKPDGNIVIRPAPERWMQVHASQQAGGTLAFKKYFQTEETYPTGHELTTYGYVHISQHDHDDTKRNWDADSHWDECVCGAQENVEGHTLDPNWQKDGEYHWQECTDQACGVIAGKVKHSFVPKHDSQNSWQECEVCHQKKGEAPHNWVTRYDDTNHWQKCDDCGAIQNTTPHTWATKHDKDNHWLECDCGAQKEKAAHSFATERDDTHHWRTCAICGVQTSAEPHDFAENCDGTNHWQECACGLQKDVTPHTFVQKHDSVNHWLECDCGAQKDVGPHTIDWTVELAATETTPGLKHGVCTVCQYRADNVIIPAIGKPNVPKTGDNAPIALWMVLLLASGTGVTLLVKRRQGHKA